MRLKLLDPTNLELSESNQMKKTAAVIPMKRAARSLIQTWITALTLMMITGLKQRMN